jgi:hypothetical protein
MRTIVLAVAAIAGVVWLVSRRLPLEIWSHREPELDSVPPILSIECEKSLVQACHQLALRELGSSARYWHHLEVFQKLRDHYSRFGLFDSAEDLLRIYEQARYAPANSLSADQFKRAKQILASLSSGRT